MFRLSMVLMVGVLCFVPAFPPCAQEAPALPAEAVTSNPQRPKANGMTPVPPEIMVTERVGADLKLDVPVVDDDGRTSPLKTFFADGQPKVLIPVYYGCPLLCTVTINRFIEALKDVPYQPGNDMSVLSFSIDPREKPELARKKKTAYLKAYPTAGTGWHFLTAPPPSIRAVTKAIGFGYRYDEASMEYLHRAAVIFVGGDGKVVRYLHGSDFKPAAIRLALLEAGGASFGTVKDRMVASLFKYDAASQRYVPNLVAIIMALGLVFFALGSLTWFGIRWIRRRA